MSTAVRFWSRFAKRHAARPIRDVAADEALLTAVSAPPNLHFQMVGAVTLPKGGPLNAIRVFNALHLVDELLNLLHHLQGRLAPAGLLIRKTRRFGDLPLRLRFLLRVLRLFPVARFLTQAGLYQALQKAGCTVEAMRAFGALPQNPYIVARARRNCRKVTCHCPIPKAITHDKPRQT